MTIKDDLIKHQVFLHRLSKTQSDFMLEGLNKSSSYLLKLLEKNNGRISQFELNKAEKHIQSILDKSVKKSLNHLDDLLKYEEQFNRTRLQKYTKEKIKRVKFKDLKDELGKRKVPLNISRPPSSLKTNYSKFSKAKIKQLLRIIRDSRITQQDPRREIINLANNLFPRQSRALADASVLGVSTSAKTSLIDNNSGMFIGMQWLSVLEPGTCRYCRLRHKRIFTDLSELLYPAHANCKCSLIPVFA